jgi:pilus assembly protein Flp/PilA
MDLVTYFKHIISPWIRSRFGRSERGASLVEYALLVALIAVVCILAITFVGNRANDKFSSVGSSLG